MMSTLRVNGVRNVITPYPKAAAHKCVRLCAFAVDEFCFFGESSMSAFASDTNEEKKIRMAPIQTSNRFCFIYYFWGKQQGKRTEQANQIFHRNAYWSNDRLRRRSFLCCFSMLWSQVNASSQFPLPKPMADAFRQSSTAADIAGVLIIRDDNQLIPSLAKINKIKLIHIRSVHRRAAHPQIGIQIF